MSQIAKRLKLINNFWQYRDIALITGIFSSTFYLTYNFFKSFKNIRKANNPLFIYKELKSKWDTFLENRIRDPVRDYFNKNMTYLLLLEEGNKASHYKLIFSNEEKKYQKINQFFKDLKEAKKNTNQIVPKDERIFMDFLTGFTHVAKNESLRKSL
jgi:hypothetical protein